MPSEVSSHANTKPVSTKESSSSSSTTATGPRRFRGDVPAFNPTGQSPHIYAQQMQAQYSAMPRHLQQQPYPQQPQFFLQHPGFMYGGQIPAYYPIPMAYPDQMYQQYSYFTMAASPFGAAPLPYMGAQFNGMSGAYMPQTARDKHPPKGSNSPYTNHLHLNAGNSKGSSQSWSSRSQSPIRLQESVTQTPETEEETAHTTQSQQLSTPRTASSKMHHSQETIKSSSASTSSKAQLPQPQESSPSGKGPEKLSKLPLFFNSSMEEYASSRRDSIGQKHNLLESKTRRLSQLYPSFTSPQTNDVIQKDGFYHIKNHNSDEDFSKGIFPHKASSQHNDSPNDNDANDEKTRLGLNWASVLQKTANKKQVAKKATGTTKAPVSVSEAKLNTLTLLAADEGPKSLGYLTFKLLFDPEFSLELQGSFAIHPRGLTNTGNICYMNAVLQCLMFCEPFNKALKFIDEKAIGSLGKKSSTPIIDATINFIKDFLKVNSPSNGNMPSAKVNDDGIVIGRPLSPQLLYSRLVENPKFQHLKWGQQEDAEEFLNYLLDGLHEDFVSAEAKLTTQEVERCIQNYQAKLIDSVNSADLKSTIKNAYRIVKNSTRDANDKEEYSSLDDESADDEKGWAEVGSGKKISKKRVVEVEPSPITQIFGGRFRSVLTVPKGKDSQSITVDPFRCMLVDVSDDDVNTIEDALWKINEVEKLPYKVGDREVIARKQTFIDQLPEVLILQLKRFSYQHEKVSQKNSLDEDQNSESNDVMASLGTIEKVMKDVRYSHDLSIPVECLSPLLQSTATQRDYKLVGVIYHHGRNAEGGHYTCDVSRSFSEKDWLRIDDTSVEKIEPEAVVEEPQMKDKSAYILMYQRK